MSWYVFALVDRRPRGTRGRGLGGPLAVRPIPGGFAVVERRADVPPVEFGTLTAHEAVVARLAASVPAILPVRFGTLLDDETLDEVLDEREEEITEALATVRGRQQFTWRRIARRKVKLPSGPRATRPDVTEAGEGAAYLRRAARMAHPALPAVFRSVRTTLGPLVAAERFVAASVRLPDSLYHLVDRTRTAQYRAAAAKVASAHPALRLSGPFAPFAFAPELL